jgi:hypothetical protein
MREVSVGEPAVFGQQRSHLALRRASKQVAEFFENAGTNASPKKQRDAEKKKATGSDEAVPAEQRRHMEVSLNEKASELLKQGSNQAAVDIIHTENP